MVVFLNQAITYGKNFRKYIFIVYRIQGVGKLWTGPFTGKLLGLSNLCMNWCIGSLYDAIQLDNSGGGSTLRALFKRTIQP